MCRCVLLTFPPEGFGLIGFWSIALLSPAQCETWRKHLEPFMRLSVFSPSVSSAREPLCQHENISRLVLQERTLVFPCRVHMTMMFFCFFLIVAMYSTGQIFPSNLYCAFSSSSIRQWPLCLCCLCFRPEEPSHIEGQRMCGSEETLPQVPD